MIDILLIAGFGAFLASAALAEWEVAKKLWLPIAFGAVVILMVVGIADIAGIIMVVKP